MDHNRDFGTGTVGGCGTVAEHPAVAAVGVVDAALTDARVAALWQLGEGELVGLRRSLEVTAARLAALTLAVTREIDVRGAAVALGAPSTAHWLAGSLRLHPGAARREVTLAHALVETGSGDRVGGVPAGEVTLPATGAALAAGTVSYPAAAEVARAVRDLPDAVPAAVRERGERFLLEQAGRLRVDHLARLGQHLLHAVDPEHAARACLIVCVSAWPRF